MAHYFLYKFVTKPNAEWVQTNHKAPRNIKLLLVYSIKPSLQSRDKRQTPLPEQRPPKPSGPPPGPHPPLNAPGYLPAPRHERDYTQKSGSATKHQLSHLKWSMYAAFIINERKISLQWALKNSHILRDIISYLPTKT